jgi:microcystin-dependent protein
MKTGTILMWAGNAAPTGYLLCDGAEVSRATYGDLFNITGTTFGVGNGSTTFNVPDLRSRTAIGVGDIAGPTAPRLADNDGVDPGLRQLSHTHTLSGTTGSPTSFALAEAFTTSQVNVADETHQHDMSNVIVAASTPSYLGLYFIIKT